MPERIQLSRAKGWRMPPNTVKVDRTTEWGNPFRVTSPEAKRQGTYAVPTVEDAVECYRLMLLEPVSAAFLASVRSALAGKNLACWCKSDQPCHADVLLEPANRVPAC